MTNLHPADTAMRKSFADMDDDDWCAIRQSLVKAVEYVLAVTPSYVVQRQETEDIVQDAIAKMLRSKKGNQYDESKTPKNYVPRCWGHMVLIARRAIVTHIEHNTWQCRDVRKHMSLTAMSEDGYDVYYPVTPQAGCRFEDEPEPSPSPRESDNA